MVSLLDTYFKLRFKEEGGNSGGRKEERGMVQQTTL